MILDDKNIAEIGQPFNQCSTRTLVWLRCDYCGNEFKRIKKEVLKSYKNLTKDSCSDRRCSVKKRADVQALYGERFLEKSKQTSLEKFGCESAMQNPDIKSKRDRTCIDRYGVTSYMQTKEYWDSRKKTCLERYGVEHPHQSEEVMNKFRATNLERYGSAVASKSPEIQKRYRKTCLEKYGVPNPLCIPENRVFGQTQKDIQDWVNGFGFTFTSDYNVLKGKELDLYDPNTGLAIEYCGLHWHHELSVQPRDKWYHHAKFQQCLDNGIQLITIFEDEWKKKNSICRSIILAKLGVYNNRIGARRCHIRNISRKEASGFYDKHHLLSSPKHSKFACGLIYNDQLVMVASLGNHPRISNMLVLDRLCSHCGYQTIGGVSKLLKRCSQWALENNHNRILTWSDNRWCNGNGYKASGFALEKEMQPDYCYVDIAKPYARISKQSQKKSNSGCPSEITEHEWSLQHRLARIWDCGKKRWLLDLS